MSEPRSPLEVMLDLAIYAPVGLALTVGEELPKLVVRGRAKLEPRVGTAQMIGKFAVAEGLRRASKLAERRPSGSGTEPMTAPNRTGPHATGPHASAGGPSTAPSTSTAPSPSAATGTSTAPSPSAATGASARIRPVVVTEPAAPTSTASAATPTGPTTSSATSAASASDPSTVPQADDLAIPGYDSLSASQVVQRLAGLASDELRAVGAYESATRGRRTILARVAQLQST